MAKAKKQGRVFATLQKLGKSLMLPISILPVAGLLLGIGSSFTNPTTIATLNAAKVLGDGTFLHGLFTIFEGVGSCIFNNLPLLFAVGVAIGFANKEKEIAALASIVSFLSMHITINKILQLSGMLDNSSKINIDFLEGMTTNVLGITTLQMGVFGGIVVGLLTAFLHNKFREIKLPDYLAFFGGNRFVPILCAFAFVIVGIVSSLIWPFVQIGINKLGFLVSSTGVIGAFIYDFIKRLLIPFGLHHVFYMPFWQTAVGGTAVVAGAKVIGAQNIVMAQLADVGTAHVSVEAAQYFMGGYPIMIFGLPAAAMAIYKAAFPENKKKAGSLMKSGAVTSIVTGITEPLEFPIIFAAPWLFVFHAVMYGISTVLLRLLGCAVACSFSTGIIDLVLFGILPGNTKTSWLAIIPVGIIMAVIYFVVFYFAITKLKLKTPGREDDTGIEIKAGMVTDPAMCPWITAGLGGIDNIENIDCCATRLRCTVKDGSKVDEALLKATGAMGVVNKGTGVQVIYGPKVNIVKGNLDAYMAENYEIHSPLTGNVVELSQIPDEAFASGSLGAGIGIEPTDPYVKAPEDGTVIFVADTKHAIGFACDNGMSLLIHIGIDTVKLNGQGFEQLVEAGASVKKGEPMLKLDLEYLKKNAPSIISPILLTELEDTSRLTLVEQKKTKASENVIFVIKK